MIEAATEVDDDIDLSDDEIEAANTRSDEIYDELVERIEECDEDVGAIIYSLWVKLTHDLVIYGWTPEQLGNDAMVHAAMQDSEGTA